MQGTRTYMLTHTEKQHTHTTATYTHIRGHIHRGAPELRAKAAMFCYTILLHLTELRAKAAMFYLQSCA